MRAHVSVGRCVNGRFHRNGIATPLIRKSFLVSCAPLVTPRPISSAHTDVFFTWPPFCVHDNIPRPAPTAFVQFCHFFLFLQTFYLSNWREETERWAFCARINGRDLCIGRLDKMSDFWEKRLFHGCWSSFPCVDVCWIIVTNHRYFHWRWFYSGKIKFVLFHV